MPYIRSGAGQVYYDEFGNGPPLLLMSGGLDPASSMLPLVEPFKDSHRVIIWDRPGQGLSEIQSRGTSELDVCFEALVDLLEALDAGPAFLVGGSEGTRHAMRTALRAPDRVRGIFMWQMSAGPVASHLRELYHEQFARLAESDGMEAVSRTPWYHERIKYVPANRDILLAMDPHEFAATKRSWANELRAEDPILCHTEEQVRGVTVPVCIVEGADNTGHLPERSHAVAALVQNGKCIPAPYGEKEWLPLIYQLEHHSPFALYACLPGLAPLIAEFVDAVEKGKWAT